jgi:hypothetical protein
MEGGEINMTKYSPKIMEPTGKKLPKGKPVLTERDMREKAGKQPEKNRKFKI